MKKLAVLVVASCLLSGMFFFAVLNFKVSDLIVKKKTTLDLNYTQSHISNLIYNLNHRLDTNKYRLLSADVLLLCDKSLIQKPDNEPLKSELHSKRIITNKYQFQITPTNAARNYLLNIDNKFGDDILSEIEKGGQKNEEESSFIVSLFFKINIAQDGTIQVKNIDNNRNYNLKKESLHNIQIKVANKYYSSNSNLAMK
jgi:hypothetical protein